MGGLAVLATFLPVPMTFDVIICDILFERGMPAQYVMVLLFTLGTFSVYPFLILHRRVSLRVASVLFLAIGAIRCRERSHRPLLENWHVARQNTLIARMLLDAPPAPRPALPPSPSLSTTSAWTRCWRRRPSERSSIVPGEERPPCVRRSSSNFAARPNARNPVLVERHRSDGRRRQQRVQALVVESDGGRWKGWAWRGWRVEQHSRDQRVLPGHVPVL